MGTSVGVAAGVHLTLDSPGLPSMESKGVFLILWRMRNSIHWSAATVAVAPSSISWPGRAAAALQVGSFNSRVWIISFDRGAPG